MGKQKPDPPIKVSLVGQGPKEGIDITAGNRIVVIAGVVLLLVACVAGWATLRDTDAQPYTPPPEPSVWPFWRVLLAAVAVLFVLAALGLLAYLGASRFLALWEKRVEIKAADNAARQIHAQAGLYPWVMSRDGDVVINPNAAPGNRIEGLNGCPVMPEAEAGTPSAEAVARASFVQIASSAGSRAVAGMLDAMGSKPPARPEMPDFVELGPGEVEQLPADVRRLLEVAEGEYKLLSVTEGADDHGAYDPE